MYTGTLNGIDFQVEKSKAAERNTGVEYRLSLLLPPSYTESYSTCTVALYEVEDEAAFVKRFVTQAAETFRLKDYPHERCGMCEDVVCPECELHYADCPHFTDAAEIIFNF